MPKGYFRKIGKRINLILGKVGYKIINSSIENYISKWYIAYNLNDDVYVSGYTIIIFSKDRALQLHALLHSLRTYVINFYSVIVLFNTSQERFDPSYQELIMEFKDEVKFFHENDFKKDLNTILGQVTTDKLLFLVDDIIFISRIDFDELRLYNEKEFLLSLRLGQNIRYSYTSKSDLSLPQLKRANKHFIEWNWGEGELEWGYPLSVDGNIFSTREIKAMIDVIDFKAPNSLELNLQVFNMLYKFKKGLAYTTSRMVNIPCNRVQDEIKNQSGNITTEELLNLWNQGLRIDYQKFYNYIPSSPHEELTFTFIKKA